MPAGQEQGPMDELQGPMDEPQGPMDELVEQEQRPVVDSLTFCCTLTNEQAAGVIHFPTSTKSKMPAPPPKRGVAKSSTAAGGGSLAPSGRGQSGIDRKVDRVRHAIVPKVSGGARVRTFLLCGKNAAPMYVVCACLYLCMHLCQCMYVYGHFIFCMLIR